MLRERALSGPSRLRVGVVLLFFVPAFENEEFLRERGGVLYGVL